MIQLLIADDHAIVREGLKKIFSLASDIEVMAEAADGVQVMQRLAEKPGINLLLLDLTMPGVSGTDLITSIKLCHPALPILVFSMHNEAQVAASAIRAGASGYIAKDSAPDVLLDAIHRVIGGKKCMDPWLAEQLAFDAVLPGQSLPHNLLSEREFEVFQLLVAGKRVNEIAEQLVTSNKTVSTHKVNLMLKMKLASTAELVRYADQHHLFDY